MQSLGDSRCIDVPFWKSLMRLGCVCIGFVGNMFVDISQRSYAVCFHDSYIWIHNIRSQFAAAVTCLARLMVPFQFTVLRLYLEHSCARFIDVPKKYAYNLSTILLELPTSGSSLVCSTYRLSAKGELGIRHLQAPGTCRGLLRVSAFVRFALRSVNLTTKLLA